MPDIFKKYIMICVGCVCVCCLFAGLLLKGEMRRMLWELCEGLKSLDFILWSVQIS